MRTAMRPRYYCDHCSKGNGSPSAMRTHEAGCTKNPNRVCRMCALVENELGREAQRPLAELTAILNADGFKAMCEAANDCPACILAVLRPLNFSGDEESPGGVLGPDDGRKAWSYRQAKDQWWKNFNDARAEQEPRLYY